MIYKYLKNLKVGLENSNDEEKLRCPQCFVDGQEKFLPITVNGIFMHYKIYHNKLESGVYGVFSKDLCDTAGKGHKTSWTCKTDAANKRKIYENLKNLKVGLD